MIMVRGERVMCCKRRRQVIECFSAGGWSRAKRRVSKKRGEGKLEEDSRPFLRERDKERWRFRVSWGFKRVEESWRGR